MSKLGMRLILLIVCRLSMIYLVFECFGFIFFDFVMLMLMIFIFICDGYFFVFFIIYKFSGFEIRIWM